MLKVKKLLLIPVKRPEQNVVYFVAVAMADKVHIVHSLCMN